MENIADSHEMLKRIAAIVDKRIDVISNIINVLQTTLSILADSTREINVARKTVADAEIKAAVINPKIDELDSILQHAKSIRMSTTEQDTRAKPHEQRNSKQSQNPPRMLRQNLGEAIKRENNIESSISTREQEVLHPIVEQLNFLGQNPGITQQMSALGIKDLYISKSMLLQRLFNRPCHPGSACFIAVVQSIKVMQSTFTCEDDNRSGTTSAAEGKQFVEKLNTAFEQLLKSFEKHVKLKIARQSSLQMSISEKEEIMAMWFRGHRLLELYDHLNNGLINTDKCTCQKCSNLVLHKVGSLEFLLNSLEMMPFFTPGIGTDIAYQDSVPMIAISNKNNKEPFKCDDNSRQIDKWKQCVTEFHSLFQNRIKYLVESMIGQCQLKECIHDIKQCCQSEAQLKKLDFNVTSVDIVTAERVNDEWIMALKSFRMIYDILMGGLYTKETTCVILSKEKVSVI